MQTSRGEIKSSYICIAYDMHGADIPEEMLYLWSCLGRSVGVRDGIFLLRSRYETKFGFV